MVGPEVERTALVRHCTRLFNVGANITTPLFSVVVRKAYGLGAQAIAYNLNAYPAERIPPLYYAKGNYFTLTGASAPFRHLIYPVPDARLPFLGVLLKKEQDVDTFAQADDHRMRRRLSFLGCLLGRFIYSLPGWLVGCRLGWLLGDFLDWLFGNLRDWLFGNLVGWLLGNLVGDLLGRLVGYVLGRRLRDLLWRCGLGRFSRLLERRNRHLGNRRHLKLGEVLHGARGGFGRLGRGRLGRLRGLCRGRLLGGRLICHVLA
jgi:hypothetical protein